ncbi:MAG: hypothetical protein J6Q07_01275 [Alistipes sp.]|nr:hypothetical protein [Alistipes sp.]
MAKKFVAKVLNNRPRVAKYPARYAPEILAQGLTSGIVDDQGNIVHGAFDDGDAIDPYSNINSDKFELMNDVICSVSPSPTTTEDKE